MRLVRIAPLSKWRASPPRPSYDSIRTASTTLLPRLDLRNVDSKWHKIWERSKALQSPSDQQGKEKAYILSMFPYPSGTLHMGHLRVYTISDVIARFKRMKGCDVLHPMGWDAFGLPAENAAMERGIDPAEWTVQNIAKMKEQLMAMGGDFDWDREFMTCDPSFYKHTQKIFLMLHKLGLAYQADALVNYDPVDKTVLANEQVDGNGRSWRSGAKVEKVNRRQWFLRITAFKEELLHDLDVLAVENGWPERVLAMQKNWIGKSAGARIFFQCLDSSAGDKRHSIDNIEVFTTRPDTYFGIQYLALSISHPLTQKLAQTSKELQDFIYRTTNLPPDSKAGYLLPNVSARLPLNNADGLPESANRSIPIYVAPYVLSEYGTGAVMGVPGHDTRDLAFWREQMPGGEVLRVISRQGGNLEHAVGEDEPFVHKGVLTSICGDYSGLSSSSASEKIMHALSRDGMGSMGHSWRLRDWLISRQRYWGTPIPIIHCQDCGAVPVPERHLPVALPNRSQWKVTPEGKIFELSDDWLRTECPRCGGPGTRDTDTMDTFVDSSWYYMRFADPHNEHQPFSPAAAAAYLPVDMYIGGVEHAILHLLYARFIYKVLSRSALFPPGNGKAKSRPAEPFHKLITQGMVHGKTYSDPATGRFLKPSEVDVTDPSSPRIVLTRDTPSISWEKMSKSKYNGVDPITTIDKYGADATRAHILFSAPVSEILEWDDKKIIGIQRWFHRLWRLVGDVRASFHSDFSTDAEIDPSTLTTDHVSVIESTNGIITSITRTYDSNPYALNTAVSDLIKLTNQLCSTLSPANNSSTPSTFAPFPPILSYTLLTTLLKLLAPIAPALSDECYSRLHEYINASPSTTSSIHALPFPSPLPIPSLAPTATGTPKTQTVAVQINGKLRFTMEVAAVLPANGAVEEQLRREWLLARAREVDAGGKWLMSENGESRKVRRVVVVVEDDRGKGKEGVKLVNIVL